MNFLVNIGSPTVRKVVYFTASACSAAWGAYLVKGDWHDAVAPFLGTIILATAGANASETPED